MWELLVTLALFRWSEASGMILARFWSHFGGHFGALFRVVGHTFSHFRIIFVFFFDVVFEHGFGVEF